MGTITKKQILMGLGILLALAAGFATGVIMANNSRITYLDRFTPDMVSKCEQDGTANCHVEYIYDGLFITEPMVKGEIHE